MSVSHTTPRASFLAPAPQYNRENEAQFRHTLEQTLIDVTAYINRVIVDPASVANHALLSANHSDALVGTVARGDLIVGNSTPKWGRMAKGTSGYFLKSTATDAVWAAHGLTYSDVGAAAASHTHVFADITDRASAATGITKVGTINTGVWQGTAVADSYISSASSWSARVLRAGDTMTGLLYIDNETVDNMLAIGDGSVEAGAPAGVISIHGDFSARRARDGIAIGGLYQSDGNPLGIVSFPSFVANTNSDFIGSAAFGCKDVDNTGGYTGLTYIAIAATQPYGTVTGTIATAYGLKVDDINVASTNYAIYTNAGLVRFGDDVAIATGKKLTSEVVQSGSATSLLLKYNTTTKVTIGTSGVTFADKLTVNDTDITRAASGIIGLPKLAVGNYATATVGVGAIADKIEVFDLSGNSLGFVPVYASIT